MADELTRLVAKWTQQIDSVLIPVSGNTVIADPNAERLAIGFSYGIAKTIRVFPIVPNGIAFSFWINGPAEKWIWWQRHGPIVALQWGFDNLGGGLDAIVVCQILRTNIGQ
jgi:hypothetical protein